MQLVKSAFYALAILASATAGAVAQDFAYADSYGNLVIEGTSGYKRILVGRGGDAERVNKFMDSGQTQQPTEFILPRRIRIGFADCYRPGAFVKGRSYMYGLSDGEMPVLSSCR